MSSYLSLNKFERLSGSPYAEQILELIFSGATHLPISHLNQFFLISAINITIDSKLKHSLLQIVDMIFSVQTLEGDEIFKLHTKGILMDCCCLAVERVVLFMLPCNSRIN